MLAVPEGVVVSVPRLLALGLCLFWLDIGV